VQCCLVEDRVQCSHLVEDWFSAVVWLRIRFSGELY
jgi:hypothetical protein